MDKNNNIPKKAKKRKNSKDSSDEKKVLNKDEEIKLFKAQKKKSSLKLKHLEISKDIIVEKDDIKYNTPTVITYYNFKFSINTRKYYELYESTWKCINYRRTKDLPENCKVFCNATIKGIRNALKTSIYTYYLIEDHSEICKNLDRSKISKKRVLSEQEENLANSKLERELENPNNEINKEDDIKEEINKKLENKDNKNDIDLIDIKYIEKSKKCKTSEDIDNLVLAICKEKKSLLSTLKIFERSFKNLYKDNNIEIKNYHLKYLFEKYKKICFPKGLDEIFIYSNYIEDLGYFCRSISKSILYDSKNKIIEHNHIIFFTELSIKRLIISENLLIDGTFTYPKGYYQTIIIMFYDPLLFKMIPGIFIGINNKTLQGYTLVFRFIRDYIYKYCQNDLSKIKWKVFTTDFEENLFNSFQKVFKKIENLEHKGCFFHYLKNIRKYLVKNGFTKKKWKKTINLS